MSVISYNFKQNNYPEDKQETLLNDFKQYDEKLFGHGMQRKFHKAFHKVIANLQKSYYTDN